jgi:hypothetical protein
MRVGAFRAALARLRQLRSIARSFTGIASKYWPPGQFYRRQFLTNLRKLASPAVRIIE